jgi:hypothetical protein
VFALLILLVFALITGIALANSFPSSIPSSRPPTRPLVQPTYSDPTLTPNVVRGGISPRLLTLNRELGIPLDQLKAMSPEQILELIEKNAERLQVDIIKLVTTTPGTEVMFTINGRKSATPSSALPQTSLPSPVLCPSVQRGLAFLTARYNPTVGLLNESPIVAPNKYWLTNDNALAAYAFARLGQLEMSATLQSSLQRYGHDSNGLIEAVWGLPVSFPPYAARQEMLSKVVTDEIWQEFHDGGPRLEDWAEYSDLGFLGALNEYQQGHIAESLAIFSNTLAQFDGMGFHDKAFNSLYATYKLALALYAGATIHAPIPNGDQLLKILGTMQTADGGFTTDYRDLDTPEGDANTETTAFALLAQSAYGCVPVFFSYMPMVSSPP